MYRLLFVDTDYTRGVQATVFGHTGYKDVQVTVFARAGYTTDVQVTVLGHISYSKDVQELFLDT